MRGPDKVIFGARQAVWEMVMVLMAGSILVCVPINDPLWFTDSESRLDFTVRKGGQNFTYFNY
jgi:hypothetical protein